MAREFLLVRVVRMREVDLARFDFDNDLTWMGFFLDPQGNVLGRYGGRDADSAEGRVSLTGLRHAMRRALAAHRAGKPTSPPPAKPRTVDEFAGTKKLPADSCIRCHEVATLRRQDRQARGTWTREDYWVYPQPENVGLSVSVDVGDRVTRVASDSAAHKAGLRAGDRLISVNGLSISSFADLQYALHRAPAMGSIDVVYQRAAHSHKGAIALTEGWRKTDLSWRWSLRSVDPQPGVQGADLTAKEKKDLGLPLARLALEQGPFLSPAARQAGIRPYDVILGVDGQMVEMTGRQFLAHIRLNHKVGDRVTYHLLRDGKRLDVVMTLRGK